MAAASPRRRAKTPKDETDFARVAEEVETIILGPRRRFRKRVYLGLAGLLLLWCLARWCVARPAAADAEDDDVFEVVYVAEPSGSIPVREAALAAATLVLGHQALRNR